MWRRKSAQGLILIILAHAGAIRTVQARAFSKTSAPAGTARAVSPFSNHAIVPLNVPWRTRQRGEGVYQAGTSREPPSAWLNSKYLSVYVIDLWNKAGKINNTFVHMHALRNRVKVIKRYEQKCYYLMWNVFIWTRLSIFRPNTTTYKWYVLHWYWVTTRSLCPKIIVCAIIGLPLPLPLYRYYIVSVYWELSAFNS